MLRAFLAGWTSAVLLIFAVVCHAAESFIVDDIRVEGLERISPGAVFNYLPISVGDSVDDKRYRDAVRALFKTGFFKDVRLERDGDVLVVIVIGARDHHGYYLRRKQIDRDGKYARGTGRDRVCQG